MQSSPALKQTKMNKYRIMTWVLVVSNIIVLVAMFIAAFWGFTYPTIMVDGYESGKSAFVAAFMCCLAGICLCGLNFQNYYLLVTYAILHLLIMLNQLFSLLPFSWTRIPNYPLTGSIATQVYVTLVPKIVLVAFAFALAYKLRRDEKRYELASSSGGLHHRLPCHIVPRPEGGPRCGPGPPLNRPPTGMFGSNDCQSGYGGDPRGSLNNGQQQLRMISGSVTGQQGSQQPPPVPSIPPPLPPTSSTNQIIQTPPIYPLHRPSVTDVSINSPNRPIAPSGICHRTPPCQAGVGVGGVLGNLSSSCGGGLNGVGTMMDEHESLTRTRSSGMQWRNAPYEAVATTPTKWWPNNNVGIGGGSSSVGPITKQQQQYLRTLLRSYQLNLLNQVNQDNINNNNNNNNQDNDTSLSYYQLQQQQLQQQRQLQQLPKLQSVNQDE